MNKKEKKEQLKPGDTIKLTPEEAQSMGSFIQDASDAKALANHASTLLSRSNDALFAQLARIKPETEIYLIQYDHKAKVIIIMSKNKL